MKIGAVTIENARVLAAGSRFLTTMQIPIQAGRELDDRDLRHKEMHTRSRG